MVRTIIVKLAEKVRNFSRTAVCGPACTVVWEDGERKLSSYPMCARQGASAWG
jgi:hypothetical protein